MLSDLENRNQLIGFFGFVCYPRQTFSIRGLGTEVKDIMYGSGLELGCKSALFCSGSIKLHSF